MKHLGAGSVLALLAVSGVAQAAGVTLTVVDAPDVVVASDYEGEDFTTPRYMFTAQVRVENGDSARRLTLSAVTYLDRGVRGCPEMQDGVRPVTLFNKNVELDRRESIVVGGLAEQEAGRDTEYWPMEVYRRYPNPTGGVSQYAAGEHGFCVLALAGGNDPDCDQPAEQVCTLASAPFRAYVRHGNEAPVLASLEVLPNAPRPGQETILRAEATDGDTVPKRDTLTYTWDFGTKERTGPVVRHTFGLPGDSTVTLTVSDGFEDLVEERLVTVRGRPVDPGDGETNGSPNAPVLLLVAALAAVALGGRRT